MIPSSKKRIYKLKQNVWSILVSCEWARNNRLMRFFNLHNLNRQINVNYKIEGKEKLEFGRVKLQKSSKIRDKLWDETWMTNTKYYNHDIRRQYTRKDNTNLWNGWNTNWDCHVYVRRYTAGSNLIIITAVNCHLIYAWKGLRAIRF